MQTEDQPGGQGLEKAAISPTHLTFLKHKFIFLSSVIK